MNKKLDKEIRKALELVFADGYEKTNLTYDGCDVYEATFEKTCCGGPFYVLADGDEAWLADDSETIAIRKKQGIPL